MTKARNPYNLGDVPLPAFYRNYVQRPVAHESMDHREQRRIKVVEAKKTHTDDGGRGFQETK